MPLSRFFEGWIYGSDLPAVAVTWRVERSGTGRWRSCESSSAGAVFDFPLTVSLQLADGTLQDVLVRVTDRIVEQSVPFTGRPPRRRGEPRSRGRAAGRELTIPTAGSGAIWRRARMPAARD